MNELNEETIAAYNAREWLESKSPGLVQVLKAAKFWDIDGLVTSLSIELQRLPVKQLDMEMVEVDGIKIRRAVINDAVGHLPPDRFELEDKSIREDLVVSRKLTEVLLKPTPVVTVPVSFLVELKDVLDRASKVISDVVGNDPVFVDRSALTEALADTAEKLDFAVLRTPDEVRS